MLENRGHHRPKLLQGELPQTAEKFLSRHVLAHLAPGFAAVFDRVIKRVAHKPVSFPIVTGIPKEDLLDSVGEARGLHHGSSREISGR